MEANGTTATQARIQPAARSVLPRRGVSNWMQNTATLPAMAIFDDSWSEAKTARTTGARHITRTVRARDEDARVLAISRAGQTRKARAAMCLLRNQEGRLLTTPDSMTIPLICGTSAGNTT